MMPEKKIIENNMVPSRKILILLVILWLFSLWKNHIGFQCDEVYNIAQGDMVVRGDALFKEIWSYLQMSAVFSAPVIWVHTQIFGSTEGILLTFRVLSVLIQTAISIYFYITFVKGGFQKKYVLIASVLFFLFVPDFQTFLYKTEIIWFAVLEIIYVYRYYQTKKTRYVILLGVMIAASVLAYPTTIIQFPIYLLILYKVGRTENRNVKVVAKQWGTLTATCVLCAVLFFILVFSKISLSEFIMYFPRVFQDDSLDSAFLTKLIRPLKKYVAMGAMVTIPIIVCMKVKKIQALVERLRMPVISMLLLLAFLGQCYIERAGITWHCLTYPYVLTLFLLPLLYTVRGNRDKNREILWLFELPAFTVVLCMALASNQGNMTSMYGSIISLMGLLLLLGDSEEDGQEYFFYRERKLIPVSLLTFALLMSIPVWDQETVMFEYKAGNIFSPRVNVTYGPAKGCAMGIPTYEEYDAICSVIENTVTEEDKLLILDSDRIAGYGYMHAKGDYASFSPQGGHNVGLDDVIVDYFECNPQKQPTVVVVNLEYIEQDFERYLKEASFGSYLEENQYGVTKEINNYLVLRRK